MARGVAGNFQGSASCAFVRRYLQITLHGALRCISIDFWTYSAYLEPLTDDVTDLL